MRRTMSFEIYGTTARFYFVVTSGPSARVSLLDEDDFTFQLMNPANVDIAGSTLFDVNELGSSGAYEGSFALPATPGEYTLTIFHPTYFPAMGKTVTFLAYASEFGDSSDSSAQIDFKVSDSAGNPVLGKVTGDFTWNIWNPLLVEVSGSVPVTFIELGNGEYRAAFDASSQQGKWFLDLLTVDDGAGGSYWTAGGKQGIHKYLIPTGVGAGKPTIQSGVNDNTGNSVTLTLVANNPADELFIYSRPLPTGTWTLFGSSRVGSGTLQITGLLDDTMHEFICIASQSSSPVLNPSPPSEPLRVYVSDSATQLTAIRQALYDWVTTTIPWSAAWGPVNNPQLPLPFCTLRMRPTSRIGEDQHTQPDAAGIDTIYADLEFMFEIELLGQASPEAADPTQDYAEQLASSLQKRTVIRTLADAGIAPVEALPIQDLTGIGSVDFLERALLEIRFRISYVTTDSVAPIETAENPSGTVVP